MAIECHEFELGIGHVVDVDVGPMEHVSDFSKCFGTSEEVQFFRDTDVDFLYTGIVEMREILFEVLKVCVSENQEHTQVFKEGCFGDVHCQSP